ncbi:MAG: ribosome assembly GTPase [Kosmotoga sp.]|nr:ribosome assembly GTPase [Kosmotoga sp.]
MKCKGCGVEIQTFNDDVPGYIPADVLERRQKEGKEILCQRCFHLKHYGKFKKEKKGVKSLDSLKKYLHLAKNVIYVIDIFDFDGTYREEIVELLKEHNVYYVINKVDLVPKEVAPPEIKKWARDRLKVQSTRVKLLSAKVGRGVSGFVKFLKSKKDRRFLVVGVTNVGKSSVLNALTGEGQLTASKYPGTTLELVQLKNEVTGLTLIDTPGIFTNDRVTDLLDPWCQAKIMPQKKLTVTTINAKKDRTVFFSSFVSITVKGYKGRRSPIFHILTSENVVVHETNPEKAEERWSEWFGRFLVPPCGNSGFDNYKFENHQLRLEAGQEIHICGLGWVNVARGPAEFTLKLPESVKWVVRDALIGPYKFKK